MGSPKQIEIQLSKIKLTLSIVGCVLFVIGGICFVTNPFKYESFIMRTPAIIFAAGVLSILFFGFMGFIIGQKLFDKTAGLIISEDGVTDNSGGLSAGFIPWTDILAIKEVKIVNQKLINIVVRNPQVYIDRQKSLLKRKAAQANYNIWGTAIGVSSNGLKIRFSELKQILEKKLSDFHVSKARV